MRESGAPERIRTSDLCLRRATLYPAELRAPADCIDQTGRIGNGPLFARLAQAGSSCGKGRTFESSRARQFPVCRECAGGGEVPFWEPRMGSSKIRWMRRPISRNRSLHSLVLLLAGNTTRHRFWTNAQLEI